MTWCWEFISYSTLFSISNLLTEMTSDLQTSFHYVAISEVPDSISSRVNAELLIYIVPGLGGNGSVVVSDFHISRTFVTVFTIKAMYYLVQNKNMPPIWEDLIACEKLLSSRENDLTHKVKRVRPIVKSTTMSSH